MFLSQSRQTAQSLFEEDFEYACGAVGESAPAGEDAVGWQMAVYWRASCQFFLASVTDYNSREKQHLVTYSNGDEEYICLSSQCIKWTQIPQSKQVRFTLCFSKKSCVMALMHETACLIYDTQSLISKTLHGKQRVMTRQRCLRSQDDF